jgi:hypothetical protein
MNNNLYNKQIDFYTNKVLGPTFYAPSSQKGYLPEFQTFNNNEELIFSGCSQTNGEHISLPMTTKGDCTKIWGFQVANYFNLSSINLGLPGESCYQIVRKLMSHFNKYGNPKILLCLFPDLYRFTSPIDKDILIANKSISYESEIETTYLPVSEDVYKYSKIPHIKEHVIPQTQSIWFNLQSILMLEQYCNFNNIKFIYSSWHEDTHSIISLTKQNTNNEFYKNFILLDLENLELYKKNNNLNCHKYLKNKYPDVFYFGVDGKHIGIHDHTHIAEKFIDKIKDYIVQ